MSEAGVVISCLVGAGAFVSAVVYACRPSGEGVAGLTLLAKLAMIASAAFALLASVFAGARGFEAMDVLAANVPYHQLRKVIYFTYGLVTLGFLCASAVVVARLWRGAHGP